MGKRYTFTINSPDEYITAIDVRAGGWIDAIRLHTNQKSSIWMGGTGGDEYHLRAPPGRIILGVMGTSGKFVGSFGLLLSRCSNDLCVMCRLDYQPLFGKMNPPPPPASGRKAGPRRKSSLCDVLHATNYTLILRSTKIFTVNIKQTTLCKGQVLWKTAY